MEACAKKRGFGHGGGGNEVVEKGIGHREFTPRQEGLVPVEGNELLLQTIYGATQVLRFHHVSARTEVHTPNLPEDVVA
eukprot:4786078-Pleurochrysis_carterae.AAC.2